MNPQQRKRAKAKREYNKKRARFLAAHQRCEIAAPGCSGASTEISHIVGNGRSGGAGYLDEENWEAACSSCGQYVEHEKEWALETGHHWHAWEYEPGMMREKARAKRGTEG